MMPLSAVAPTIADRIGTRTTLLTGLGAVRRRPGAAGHDGRRSTAATGRSLPGLLVIGLGIGLAMSPSTTAITESLPAEKQGVASALNDTVREFGGAIGIALLGSVLNSGYRSGVSVGGRIAARWTEGAGRVGHRVRPCSVVAVGDGAGPVDETPP